MIRLRLRAELRARAGAWLLIALLVGLGAAVVLAALVAAARSEDAYARFTDSQDAADALVVGQSPFLFVGNVDVDEVARLPGVARSARASVLLLFAGRTGTGRTLGPADVFPIVTPDGRLGTEIERWRMLEGRRARPGAAGEVTVSFLAAERLGLRVGSRLRFRFVEADQFVPTAAVLLAGFQDRLASATVPQPVIDQLAKGPVVDLRVVGIEASPAEFPPLGDNIAPPIHLTPAFADRYRGRLVESPLLYVRLRRGDAGLEDFEADVEELGAGQQTSLALRGRSLASAVQRTTRTEALAARATAGLVGLALVVATVQFLARLGGRDAADRRSLHAIGVTDRQLVAVAALRSAAVGLVAAAVAVVLAWLCSPLGTVGLAAKADLRRGRWFDGGVLVPGGLAVLVGCTLLGVLVAVWSARRARVEAREQRRADRPSTVGRLVDGLGLPPTLALGVRFVVAPPSPTRRVPLRGAAAALGLAVALLVGTATFVHNLNRLLDTPSRYGWTWDVEVGAPGLPGVVADPLAGALRSDRDVQAFAGGTLSQLFLRAPGGDVVRTDVLALRQHEGTVVPTLLEGRQPRRPDEIVVGSRTLSSLGLEVGDRVTASVGDRRARMRIVGRAVVPGLGEAGASGTRTLITFAGLTRLLPDAGENVFLVRFRPSADADRAFRQVKGAVDPLPTLRAVRPTNLASLARIRSVPAVLIGLLATIAVVALVSALAASIRRRRRELALLRALGMRRRQVIGALLCEATAIVAVAVLVGAPLGALAGRAAWRAFAVAGGLATDAAWPPGPVLLSLLLLFVIAGLVVLVTARAAVRSQPGPTIGVR